MAKTPSEYTALDVAKWFVNAADYEAGDAMTHLKVQKLIYYAQGWALALLGTSLFDEDLEAWAHGPVAQSVWKQFKGFGYEALPRQKITRKIEGRANRLLESINREYGIYTAKRLEYMTHKEAPWRDARGDLPKEARTNEVISKTAMRKFFEHVQKHGFKY